MDQGGVALIILLLAVILFIAMQYLTQRRFGGRALACLTALPVGGVPLLFFYLRMKLKSMGDPCVWCKSAGKTCGGCEMAGIAFAYLVYAAAVLAAFFVLSGIVVAAFVVKRR